MSASNTETETGSSDQHPECEFDADDLDISDFLREKYNLEEWECSRPVWEEASENRCVWHASDGQTQEKPRAELKKAVGDGDLHGSAAAGVILSGIDFPVEMGFIDADLSGGDLRRRDADLSGATLPDSDLSGAYLKGADLSGAHLRYADLSGAHLRYADLSGADLRYADLSEAGLFDADLSEAGLFDADLSDANLVDANLSGADLTGANLSDATVEDAQLLDARFEYTIPHDEAVSPIDIVPESNLAGADLSGAGLGDANLSEADLSEADLDSADLGDANLPGADLRDANLSEAHLRYADLSGADLRRADLSEAYLPDSDLSGAYLRRANLSEAQLFHANLSEAHLRYADLSGADLRRADLSEATLRDADLSGADLRRADLSEATLRDADLSEADLGGADLSDANLVDADLSEADLGGADLSGADFRETQFSDITANQATTVGKGRSDFSTADEYDKLAKGYHNLKTALSEEGLSQRARQARTLERQARTHEARKRFQREVKEKMKRQIKSVRQFRSRSGDNRIQSTQSSSTDLEIGSPRNNQILTQFTTWIGGVLSRLLTGYGTRPTFVLGWTGLILLLTTAWFELGPVPSDLEGGPLYYSVVTFVTSPPHPIQKVGEVGMITEIIVLLETYIGTTLTVLLGYVLGNRERV